MPLRYDVKVFQGAKKLPNATLIIQSQNHVDEEGTLCTTEEIQQGITKLNLLSETTKHTITWSVNVAALIKRNGDHSFRYKVKVTEYYVSNK